MTQEAQQRVHLLRDVFNVARYAGRSGWLPLENATL